VAFRAVRMDTYCTGLAPFVMRGQGRRRQAAGTAPMPNDAKLGLVLGLAVVTAVSAVFYRGVGQPASSLTEEVKAAAVPSRKPAPPQAGQVMKARPAARTKNNPSLLPAADTENALPASPDLEIP